VSPGREPSRLLRVLVGVAALAGLLHAANLVHLARARDCALPTLACPGQASPWPGRDTSAYRAAAAEIRAEGLFGASWLERMPGYPLVLLAAEGIAGDDAAALWWGPPLAALAAAGIGWIAGWLSGSVGAALAAGLCFCLWPNAYQYSARLLTDGPHGLLAVSALAATLCWRETGKPAAAGAAGLLWMAAQTLRPTFFALPLLLPLLLWKRERQRRDAALALALWLASLVVPLGIVTANQLRHGLWLPPIACYAAPRLEAELALTRRPEAERVPAVERTLFAHFRRRCMERYHADPAAQAARDRDFLLAHPGAAARSAAGEIADQMLYPSRPYAAPGMESLYGGWRYPAAGERSVGLAVFWLASIGGLARVARRDPGVAAFFALAAGLVMLPAANSHLVGARLRFPVDLMALPVVLACVVAALRRVPTPARLRREDPMPEPGRERS
jgi:hypothetical protein